VCIKLGEVAFHNNKPVSFFVDTGKPSNEEIEGYAK
jgi:hypothetical protein